MNGTLAFNSVDSTEMREPVRLGIPKIIATEGIERPAGYDIPGKSHVRVTATLNGCMAEGWGSGSNELAEIKATSEAFERLALHLTNGGKFKSRTSNGWAAHPDPAVAAQNALSELIERDSALNAWFGNGSYLAVPECMWPADLQNWNLSSDMNLEFRTPEVLLSVGPNGVCTTVLLRSSTGCVVVGHASGVSFEEAVLSAFNEALRSAHAALQFDSISEVISLHSEATGQTKFSPNANALAYAYGISLPQLNVREAMPSEVVQRWENHVGKLSRLIPICDVAVYEVGDRFVAQVVAPGLTEVFWGKTPCEMNVKNKRPHFVG